MQQMQLWIFWSIMAAFIVCGCILTWKPTKKPPKKTFRPAVPDEHQPGHHDALEFPDGQIVLLTLLAEDQQATILQLPAEPKTAVEAESQSRAAYVG